MKCFNDNHHHDSFYLYSAFQKPKVALQNITKHFFLNFLLLQSFKHFNCGIKKKKRRFKNLTAPQVLQYAPAAFRRTWWGGWGGGLGRTSCLAAGWDPRAGPGPAGRTCPRLNSVSAAPPGGRGPSSGGRCLSPCGGNWCTWNTQINKQTNNEIMGSSAGWAANARY